MKFSKRYEQLLTIIDWVIEFAKVLALVAAMAAVLVLARWKMGGD